MAERRSAAAGGHAAGRRFRKFAYAWPLIISAFVLPGLPVAPALAEQQELPDLTAPARAATEEAGPPPERCEYSNPATNVRCAIRRQKQRRAWSRTFLANVEKDFGAPGDGEEKARLRKAAERRLSPVKKAASEDWKFIHEEIGKMTDPEERRKLYIKVLLTWNRPHPAMVKELRTVLEKAHQDFVECHPFYRGGSVRVRKADLRKFREEDYFKFKRCNGGVRLRALRKGSAIAKEYRQRGFGRLQIERASAQYEKAVRDAADRLEESVLAIEKKAKGLAPEVDDRKRRQLVDCVRRDVRLGKRKKALQRRGDALLRARRRLDDGAPSYRIDRFNSRLDSYQARLNALKKDQRKWKRECGGDPPLSFDRPTVRAACREEPAVRRFFKDICD